MKIIVEAGVNWHDLEEAKVFIKKSKELRLFATKFQIYNDEIIRDSEHYEFLKSIQLDYDKAKELFNYGKEIGQEVFFTPMFEEAVEWCEQIGVNYYKIRFKDRYNQELIKKIMDLNKPFFISSNRQKTVWGGKTIHLFCIPKYPARWSDYYGDLIIWQACEHNGFYKFEGLSDHTPDLQMLKWILIEKNHEWKGFDYLEKHMKLNDNCIENKWSVSFEQLKEVLEK